MTPKMIAASALHSLADNRLRTFLATLGIVIGVAAVIVLMAIGAGAKQQVLGRIASMGTDLLVVRPTQRVSGGVLSGTQQNLTVADARAILNEVVGAWQVSPVVGGMVQAKQGGKNSRIQMTGVALPYLTLRSYPGGARIALIGPTVVTDLFGAADPLGATVTLDGIAVRVVGVLKSKGDQGFFNPDNQVLLPYTLAMRTFLGVTNLREIDVQATSGADQNQVKEAILALIRRRHRVTADAANDVAISGQAELMEAVSSIGATLTIFLGAIAGISLLVGGIGIMNTMLVSVTERTREIGVRKAVGARRRDILRQFLIEAVLVCLGGGLTGVALGLLVAWIVARIGLITPVVEPLSIVLALGASAGVGIFFGWYPARRAAALDPIEALRHE
jgi:putative ABC transport system permease protein